MGDMSVGKNKERYYEVDQAPGKVANGKNPEGEISNIQKLLAKVKEGGKAGAQAEKDLAKSGVTINTINKADYNDKLLSNKSDSLNKFGTDDNKLTNFLKYSGVSLLKNGDKTYEVTNLAKGQAPSKKDLELVDKAIRGDAGAKAELEKKDIGYKELTGGASEKASAFLTKHGKNSTKA